MKNKEENLFRGEAKTGGQIGLNLKGSRLLADAHARWSLPPDPSWIKVPGSGHWWRDPATDELHWREGAVACEDRLPWEVD